MFQNLYGDSIGFIVGVDGILDELEMAEVLKVSLHVFFYLQPIQHFLIIDKDKMSLKAK